jgi:hypothetical protein
MASSKKTGIMSMAGLQRSAATLRRFLPAAIWRPLGALANGIITPIRFSLATGHWKSSLAMSARAADGTPLPWYTYPAIDFLAQRDFRNCNVLEFGGGQSTLWWSAKARSVMTIERDAAWFGRLQSQVGANVSLHHIPVDRVTRTIQPVIDLIAAHPIRKFDIIVVDGHLRQEVAALAFDYLAPPWRDNPRQFRGLWVLRGAQKAPVSSDRLLRLCARRSAATLHVHRIQRRLLPPSSGYSHSSNRRHQVAMAPAGKRTSDKSPEN